MKADDITPVAQRPRTIPLETARTQLELSMNALKRAIASDTEERLPDDIRRVPGGRHEGSSYYVIKRQFELVVGPIDGDPGAPMVHRRPARDSV